MRRRTVRSGVSLLLAALLVALGTACAGPARDSGVTFVDDIDFGAPEGITLDVCAPAERLPGSPAIISVHGGGWSHGDKQQRPWRESCRWLASEGFVVFQTNYRLAPAHPFPAAIDDVTAAVEWIRDVDQVARFGHDPARLGAFGDSAGGNIVALLGTRGEGDTSAGSRVAAVVELSAPIDLTEAGVALGGLSPAFQRVQLDYLGCVSYQDCPDARAASPSHHVDASDPAFFIAHSAEDFIPHEQADAFAAELERTGVDVTVVRAEGDAHGLALLDPPLRDRITDWLRLRL